MRLRISIAVLVLLLFSFNAKSGEMRGAGYLLDSLDSELSRRAGYAMQREERIIRTKELLAVPDMKDELLYSLNDKLYREYYGYCCDSVLHYLNRNLLLAAKMGNADYANETRIRLSTVCSSSGMYLEAKEQLDSIDRKSIGNDRRILEDYYYGYINLYKEMYLYTQEKAKVNGYRQICQNYIDSIKTVVEPESDRDLYFREEGAKWRKDYATALALNGTRLSRCAENTPAYSVVTFQRALIFDMAGDSLNNLRFLVKSAISDIVTATKDNASLNAIAKSVFAGGDVDRAIRYTRIALEDASFYNAKLRYTQVSNSQSIIEQAYDLKNRRQKSLLMLAVITALVLMAGLAVVVVILAAQRRSAARSGRELEAINKRLEKLNGDLVEANEKMSRMNSDITEAGKIKEDYIGFFLGMCSEYIDKLASYRRLIKAKVINGQYEDLKQIVSTPDVISQELRNFYLNFDSTFLNIYPDYVKDFNDLLKPEARITPKKKGELTPELRIFALIRIGIDNSAQIAKLLRYSPQTIYNYRSSIKAQALDKDTFDKSVLRIGLE